MTATMAGLMVYTSLADALRDGFMVYDRTPTGYIVRKHTPAGWVCAIVDCTPK